MDWRAGRTEETASVISGVISPASDVEHREDGDHGRDAPSPGQGRERGHGGVCTGWSPDPETGAYGAVDLRPAARRSGHSVARIARALKRRACRAVSAAPVSLARTVDMAAARLSKRRLGGFGASRVDKR